MRWGFVGVRKIGFGASLLWMAFKKLKLFYLFSLSLLSD